MDTLEKFITNSLVVKLDSYGDIILFIKHAQKMGIKRINDLIRISKGDYQWMDHNIPYKELCIEYQMGKGFTISDKTGNLKYGNEVISLDEFMKDTTIKKEELI